MKCERAKELFSEYLEGSIDYALTATVRAHIDQCDGCKGDLVSFRRTWDAIGALPEVEPPSSFRHDVVMRAARLQHEHRKTEKQGFLGVTWDYLFGRLLPARAIAIACAGAVLAAVLLNLPQGIFTQFSQESRVFDVPGEGLRPPSSIEASPLNAKREDWLGRIGNYNALWVSVESASLSEGSSYYELVLTINNKALATGVTNRIPAQVYILPAGVYRLEPGSQRKPVWSGNVLGDAPLPLTVPGITNSQGEPVPITLLVTYQFRKMQFSKVVFIPSRETRQRSTDAFGLAQNGAQGRDRSLFGVLQAVSQEYSTPIIANGSLDKKPSVVDIGSGDIGGALRKVLEPVDLDWAFIDKSVHVDRHYRHLED